MTNGELSIKYKQLPKRIKKRIHKHLVIWAFWHEPKSAEYLLKMNKKLQKKFDTNREIISIN